MRVSTSLTSLSLSLSFLAVLWVASLPSSFEVKLRFFVFPAVVGRCRVVHNWLSSHEELIDPGRVRRTSVGVEHVVCQLDHQAPREGPTGRLHTNFRRLQEALGQAGCSVAAFFFVIFPAHWLVETNLMALFLFFPTLFTRSEIVSLSRF